MFDTPEISLIDLPLSHLKFHQIQKHDFPPTFCLCFTFSGINFQRMLHHACDVWVMMKTCVDQSELENVGAQID